MKKITRTVFVTSLICSLAILLSFIGRPSSASPLTGAWHWQQGDDEATISFVDNYCSFASFNRKTKKFNYTWGGPFTSTDKKIAVQVEFNTQQKELVGTAFGFEYQMTGNKLLADFSKSKAEWSRVDDGQGALAGVWRISGRKQGETISDMPLGVRRTLKILTGKRFQWAAINIETKEFFGTGGGYYTFENGKYTEHIEFFSRDSSRVGASLSFDGKVENGAWHHSGASSRGEPIYEIWKHLNQ